MTSTLHWFQTELLTREEILVGLMAVNRDVIGQAESLDRSDRTVLDMDSSESPLHAAARRQGYNGHFESSATVRCFCSTIAATAWRRSCAPATSTAPTTLHRQLVSEKRLNERADRGTRGCLPARAGCRPVLESRIGLVEQRRRDGQVHGRRDGTAKWASQL